MKCLAEIWEGGIFPCIHGWEWQVDERGGAASHRNLMLTDTLITPWLLLYPGASQYLGSSVCSKLCKRKRKNVSLSILNRQLLCLGQSLLESALLQHHCGFVFALHEVWCTVRYQILAAPQKTLLMVIEPG